MSYNRRRFLKNAATGVAGTLLAGRSAFAESAADISIKPLFNEGSDESYWRFLGSQFSLKEGLKYFNNGSLGPSPEYVIDRTEKFRRELDGFPSKYMWGGWQSEKEKVRVSVAKYLNVDSEEIAIIHNTSEGMNLFAHSFNMQKDDEIILADHEHRTGVAPYKYFCEPNGVKLVRPTLPLMPSSKDELIDAYRKAITPRTRVISMVHMTNTNGMILPVKEISELAHEKGIYVCVDAAQTIGMIKTDLKDLGCDFYAASGHKWLWGPKGTGILYAEKDKQDLLNPLMVSNDWDRTDIRKFEDYNTHHLTDVLGLGSAIEFNNIIGQEKKEARIFELKHYFRDQFVNDNRFVIKTPSGDDLSAGIQVIEVVGKDVWKAAAFLSEKFNIDCRPMSVHNLNALRISLSLFNTLSDVDLLKAALIKFASL